jgi:diaminopimelate epimerase
MAEPMKIPFVKAQGAGNDFLLTFDAQAPQSDRPAIARAICHRQFGVGADGWYLVSLPKPGAENNADVDASIHLYNSDGSEAELSGNGTRCVAAWLASLSPGKHSFRLRTGAGIRRLELLGTTDYAFRLAMNMGSPVVSDEEAIPLSAWTGPPVAGNRVDVGNPQFAVEVDSLAFDWKELGRQLEEHRVFPHRSNISFYRRRDAHTIQARFYERGAGPTLSSGTGSTGALAAALAKGLITLPAAVETEAGLLQFSQAADGLMLEGSAMLIAEGLFFYSVPASAAGES